MMPSEKMAQFSSAPPLKRLKSAATPPALSAVLRNHSDNTAWFTPGVVMAAPSRTITIIARVKRIRRRSSGIFTVFRNAEIIDEESPSETSRHPERSRRIPPRYLEAFAAESGAGFQPVGPAGVPPAQFRHARCLSSPQPRWLRHEESPGFA